MRLMEGLKYVLAIDLGTSGPKVILFSSTGKLIGKEFQKTKLNVLEGGGAEQSPDDWWEAIMNSTKRLLSKKMVPIEDIVAVSCTGQWAGTVALDKRGNHLMDAMIWLDSRGANATKKMISGFPKVNGYSLFKLRKWIKYTGGAPSPSGKDPFGHILYIKKHFPDIYKNTYKFLEPKDYLNFKFTGKMVSTYDTMTLHWITDCRDINNIKYEDTVLKMSGIPLEKLPKMIKSTEIIGNITKEVAQDLGLSPNVKVVGGTPDMQSALIGAGAVRDYEVNLCIGSSSFISFHVPFKKIDIMHNIVTLPSGIPGRYFVACEQETAAVCVRFLKENLFFPKDQLSKEEAPDNIYDVFDEMVKKCSPGSNKLIFTPWMYGERAPVDDHYTRGGFYNISLSTTRAEMVRAVYEGVAMNCRWLFKYASKFLNKKIEYVNMNGGGAKSDIWCQIFADVLGYKVRQVKEPTMSNAKGAAMVALDGLGLASFKEIADKSEYSNIFEPNHDNKETYDLLFKEFVTIFNNNKKTYYQLNNKE